MEGENSATLYEGSAEVDQSWDQLIEEIKKLTKVIQAQTEQQLHSIQQQNGAHAMKKFLKHCPPTFKGEMEPLEAEKWLLRLEHIFEYMGFSEEAKTEYAVFMLEGKAEHWWQMTRRFHFNNRKAITWKEFCEAFNEKYFLKHVRDKMTQKFHSLTQGNMTVTEYKSKFCELECYGPRLFDNPVVRAEKFQWGLKHRIREKVVVIRPQSMEDVVERAIMVEKHLEDIKKRREQQMKRPHTDACYKCGKEGHKMKDCQFQ